MGAENFNRQFILVDFTDLDNPDFLKFTRSPEFSTYLVMRRHVWRSRQPHYMGLHNLYADGSLACSLEREQIADLLGLSLVSISNDIQALARRKVIESRRTGRQNIFVLGGWVEAEGAYYEHFYLDRLYVRSKENLMSELSNGRNIESFISDDNLPSLSEVKKPLPNNREGNRERDGSNIRSAPTQNEKGERRGRKGATTPGGTPEAPPVESAPQQKGARAREAVGLAEDRLALGGFIEDFRREFNDQAPAGATLTRAINLYRRSGLTLEEFQALLYDARRLTQQHTAAIRTQLPAAGAAGRLRGKPKMAYFFGVLKNALGLDEEPGSGAAEGAASAPEAESPTSTAAPTDPTSLAGTEREFVEAVANAAMSRNVSWRLARDLARENPHLLADWLDHGGGWTLERDPGGALAKLIRAGERPPQARISGD